MHSILFTELHAFQVECEFTENEGLTVLKSNGWTADGWTFPETEEDRCGEPNCFNHTLEYPASSEQLEVQAICSLNLNWNWLIKALIEQSASCKQRVKHVCSSNALTNLSSWTGRNGIVHSYWSGDKNATEKGIGSIVVARKDIILLNIISIWSSDERLPMQYWRQL